MKIIRGAADWKEFDEQKERLSKLLAGYGTEKHYASLTNLRTDLKNEKPATFLALLKCINTKISENECANETTEREHVLDELSSHGYKTGRRNGPIRVK